MAERFEHLLSETAKIWQSLEYLPAFDDFDLYLLHVEAGVEAALNSDLNLRVVVQDRYDSDPAPAAEHNDVSLIASLVYKI